VIFPEMEGFGRIANNNGAFGVDSEEEGIATVTLSQLEG
jgi:hypothetical protein